MSKHTPGEWKFYPGKKKHQDSFFIVAVENDKRTFVGKTYTHEGQPGEANAQLIASAPE